MLTLLFATADTFGQVSFSVRPAIDSYMYKIAEAESGATPHGVESMLAAVENLREVLFARMPGDTRLVLEVLSESEFVLLDQLPGVFVRRDEVLVFHPDAGFFLQLAERNGDRADRRFAAALADTYPDDYWPAYTRSQTEYSGCTVFENSRLLKSYLAWSAMERDFPDRYVSAVSRERGAVADEIVASTCACGDKASVVGGLDGIAEALKPTDPIFRAVRERLAALDENRSNIRFRCVSG